MIRYKTLPWRKQFQMTNYFSSQALREMIRSHGEKKDDSWSCNEWDPGNAGWG